MVELSGEPERARTRLPNRRLRLVEAFSYGGVAGVLAEIGFDAEGVVREIFCEGLKPGSDVGVLMQDACILVSMLLQHGYRAEELLAKLVRADVGTAADRFRDDTTGVQKPSLVAALLMRAVQRELTDAEAVREAYRCAAGLDPWRALQRRPADE